MRKLFASVAAVFTLGAGLPAAAQDGGPILPASDIRAHAEALTVDYCSVLAPASREIFCDDVHERRRFSDAFGFVVGAAGNGDAINSVSFYRFLPDAIVGAPANANLDPVHTRLSGLAATGVCARLEREESRSCTPEQVDTLRRLLKAAYAAEPLALPAHSDSPGAAETRVVLDADATQLQDAMDAVLSAPAAAYQLQYVPGMAQAESWCADLAGRNLHTCTPEQLSAIAAALAEYDGVPMPSNAGDALAVLIDKATRIGPIVGLTAEQVLGWDDGEIVIYQARIMALEMAQGFCDMAYEHRGVSCTSEQFRHIVDILAADLLRRPLPTKAEEDAQIDRVIRAVFDVLGLPLPPPAPAAAGAPVGTAEKSFTYKPS